MRLGCFDKKLQFDAEIKQTLNELIVIYGDLSTLFVVISKQFKQNPPFRRMVDSWLSKAPLGATTLLVRTENGLN